MSEKGEKKNKKEKLPFYERKSSDLLCKIAGTASGFMVLASPFFNWKWLFVHAKNSETAGISLFDAVKYVFSREYHGKAVRQMIPAGLILLILLMGVLILYITWRDQYRPGTAAESKLLTDRALTRFRLISRLVPVVILIAVPILMSFTYAWKVVAERFNATYASWSSMINTYKRINGTEFGMFAWKLPGLGCLLLTFGILLYLFAEIYRYVINTLNEDD